MSRVTRFAARDPGAAARMVGFMAHLRDNGMRLGVGEAEIALAALCKVTAVNPSEARNALRAVCAGSQQDVQRFDDLFDTYWLNGGRVSEKSVPKPPSGPQNSIKSSRSKDGEDASAGTGQSSTPDGGDGEADRDGLGRLMAVEARSNLKKDLREMITPEEISAATEAARQLGAALRYKRSRRRKAARKGRELHFRRILRQSLATGGEPIALPRKSRPDRAMKIVALCDVSGSMTIYAQVFLAFLAGLMRSDDKAQAFLFHTRLVPISDALRDRDPLRMLGKLSLMAEGFGGGSKIGGSLDQFARTHARTCVDGRTVVLILSDGYDTDPADKLDQALARLKRRGAKLIWLNPLKGWADYAPVAQGMATALPHLDLFAAANRLEDLAALELELCCL